MTSIKSKSNINDTVINDLCLSCGICEGACPTGSITMSEISGQYKPVVADEKCINAKGCSKCYDICPGQGTPISELSMNLFDQTEIKEDGHIGRFETCYTGHSTDHHIRYRSASGGLVTQMLLYLLETKLIDGAVVATFDKDTEYLSKTIIATTKEEIINARSSKYCPVSMDGIVKELKKKEGKYIIVGIPCHIEGFRKLESIDRRFKERVFGYFALYCSGTNTFNATKYLFKEKKIEKVKLSYFAYRDYGCLGSMVAEQKTPTGTQVYKEPYLSYKKPFRSFFLMNRCVTCIDHYGELGDISFGDIHYGEYAHDEIGTNSVVVRNKYFHKLLLKAQDEGKIELRPLQPEILRKSQRVVFQKKERSKTFMDIDRILLKKNPTYDANLKDSNKFKSTISYIHTKLQLFIGQHENLWFIIKLLDRIKK